MFSTIYTFQKERYFLSSPPETQKFNRPIPMSSKLSESSVTTTTGLLEFELLGAKEFPHVDQPKELSTSCEGPGTAIFFSRSSLTQSSYMRESFPFYMMMMKSFILTYVYHMESYSLISLIYDTRNHNSLMIITHTHTHTHIHTYTQSHTQSHTQHITRNRTHTYKKS